jgi:nitrite reductase/ring-hydroxylating ferredoxin subunit
MAAADRHRGAIVNYEDDIQWRAVGAVEDWADGAGRLVQIGAREIGVYRLGDDWYAAKDICPHAGVSLVSGSTAPGCLTEPLVACPAHGWAFDLRTGQRVGPFDCSIAVYPVRIRAGTVEVGV